jgi:hypothetical protein
MIRPTLQAASSDALSTDRRRTTRTLAGVVGDFLSVIWQTVLFDSFCTIAVLPGYLRRFWQRFGVFVTLISAGKAGRHRARPDWLRRAAPQTQMETGR